MRSGCGDVFERHRFARGLAKYFETVLQGMSAQAMDGATRKSLLAVAEIAMRAWPERG